MEFQNHQKKNPTLDLGDHFVSRREYKTGKDPIAVKLKVQALNGASC
jgi:hypothetical protein